MEKLDKEKALIDKDKFERTPLEKEFLEIMSDESNDVKNENANMNGDSPAGKMMKFASASTKNYAIENLLSDEAAEAHKNGVIHIHDLDYYVTKSATCCQYNLEELFEKGFKTRNGYIRSPKTIQVYAELAAIIFQTAQNEMHGGQAVPAFDYFLAPGVNKSYILNLKEAIEDYAKIVDIKLDSKAISSIIEESKVDFDNTSNELFESKLVKLGFESNVIKNIVKNATKRTIVHSNQALQGFIYNLNTQHSRGGNQVVFSSINVGTDRSRAGRQVIKSLLKALREGLGNGETSIFPIVIFKVKDNVSWTIEDYNKAMSMTQEEWFNETNKWIAPNFDLILEAVSTTSLRLFPNFMFLDTEYNKHEKWDINDPKSWMFEPATMGCRTRTFENVNGEKTSVSRGNISFTSLNLPYIALELLEKKGLLVNGKIKKDYNISDIKVEYLQEIKNISNLVAQQLFERYQYQITALAKQFPFLMQNGILKNGEKLSAVDRVEEVYKQGTLSIGFVGLAEALKALLNEHHGQSKEAQEFGLEVIKVMNKVANKWKDAKHLNFGVIGTPAESVAGRMAKVNTKRFGIVSEVTGRDYLTNSNHVPVYHDIKAAEKVRIEAEYHQYTLGGSISYIELDGEAKKNLHSVLAVLKEMYVSGTNYGSLNHPVDRCKECNYTSLIPLKCPKCASEKISRTRRITGYLVGDLDGWNSGKQAEERDRVKHNIKK